MSENNTLKMTEFDQLVSSEPLQIMKAMIPYVPPSGQRLLSLYSKALELQNTVRAFQNSGPDVSICSAPDIAEPENPLELLGSLREYCSPATRKKMDDCINVITMLQMAEVLRGSEEEASEGGADDTPNDWRNENGTE